MRILITGAGGQVGRELTEFCGAAGDEVIACDRGALDVTDRDSVLQAILSVRPEVVVHAGAWTAVDACEGDPDHALLVNGLGTRHVAEAAAQAGAHLVYLSTDYVFDGTLNRPYVEWDEPNPQSMYGRSKLGGEREVQTLIPGATIVRTSWISGRHGSNIVKTVLRLLERLDRLTFVNDQWGHPTFVSDLVPVLRRLSVERRPGIFHVTNQRAVTWYGFAQSIAIAAGADASRIDPIMTVDLVPPRPAHRPANSVLDNAALRLSALPLLDDFEVPLARLVRELQA